MSILLFTITKTFQRNQLLTLTLTSLLSHNPIIPSTFYPLPFCNSFLLAFHRTSLLLSQTHLHFSRLLPFTTRSFNDPFDLVHRSIHCRDPVNWDFIKHLKRAADFLSIAESVKFIDDLDIRASRGLVCSTIWELREEWRVALLSYRWGEKWGCIDERACELMVWVLGNHRKFGTAWTLIRDLHKSSMSIRHAMLIMIDRYSAANDPGKAIWTFKIMERFHMIPDQEAYYFLLKALSKRGNLEEAEEFMLASKKLFPLETDAFNIILNGWCNICVDVLEAKRIWREMSNYCITPNAISYTHLISCFSKTGNLFDSLRLYDQMKKKGWTPGLEVYNSLIYVLTRENCLSQALKILDKIKEAALHPDSATYNSLLCPLCEAKKMDDARSILTKMLEDNLRPTMETYHAFLEVASFDGTLEVLDQMKSDGLSPTGTTFHLILSRFIKLKQLEEALKIWEEMKCYKVVPDCTHYTLLVEGLARFGMLSTARDYYAEMVSNGFPGDPKLQKILREPVENKNDGRKMVRQTRKDSHLRRSRGKNGRSLQYKSKKKLALDK